MRNTKIFLVSLILIVIPFHNVLHADIDSTECLVIGQESDPVQGQIFFKKAMTAWRMEQRTEAVENYEKAIIFDHSILKFEDHGMAKALLEKYRDISASATPALLCKKGFLENIVIGNLQESVSLYEEAALNSNDPQTINLANNEAKRLQQELKYITDWQKSVEQVNAQRRKKDLNEYLQKQEIRSIQSEVEDNSILLEELQQRLAYLQRQEKEVSDEMYSSMKTAARYRRRYYYPESYQSSNPPENSENSGNYTGQTNYGNSGKAALNRYYSFRNAATENKDKLAQIRAEISGVQGRIAKLKKSTKELREKASGTAIK